MFIKKTGFGVLCALMICGGYAQADSVDNISTVTADITFTSPTNTVTAVITPSNKLTSGSVQATDKFASLDMSATGGNAVRMAYRYTPGVGTISAPSSTDTGYVEVTGQNDPTNKLKYSLKTDADASLTQVSGTNGGDWFVGNTAETLHTVDIIAGSAQTIAADNYHISFDVAEYHP